MTENKINKQNQSLNYILLNLAKLRKDYAALQAEYSFSSDTHFLLLKPASLFKKELFIEKVGKIILDFYKLFPDEGIVLTEKNEAGTLTKGESILKKDGFHLPVDLMASIVEIEQPKKVEEHGVFYIIKDDFEVIDYIKSIPNELIIGDKNLINFISDKSHYGKDIIAAFGYLQNIHVFYKYGELGDSGLFLIFTDYKYKDLMIEYAVHPDSAFTNPVLKKKIVEKLKLI